MSVQTATGTSFSAPYVVGAASFLLWWNNDLTNETLKKLLTQRPYAAPMDRHSGSTTSTQLDLYGALLGIEGEVTGAHKVLKKLADFDDGTPDGNQRVHYDDRGEPVADCSECLCPRRENYLGGPAIYFEREGDQKIDLRDFRRFRDAYLLDHGYTLDGEAAACKNDLNQDGTANVAPGEPFAREDLNGDGRVGDEPTRVLDQEHTDLELFETVYEEDDIQNWEADQLSNLLYSADLILRKDPSYAPPSVPYRITVQGEADPRFPMSRSLDQDPLQDIRFEGDDLVVTTPYLKSPRIQFVALYEDEPDLAVLEMRLDDLAPGEDRVVVLGCPTLTLTDTFVATATRSCSTSQFFFACFAATCATPCVGSATLEASGGPDVQACAEDPDNCPYEFEWTCESSAGSCSFSGDPLLTKTLHHSTTLFGSACGLAEGSVTARVNVAGCPSWAAAELVVPFECQSFLECI